MLSWRSCTRSPRRFNQYIRNDRLLVFSYPGSDQGVGAGPWALWPPILWPKSFFFFFKMFWRTIVLLWGHWHPCFGFLVTSSLGFKARVGSALFALSGGVHYMLPDIHFWCYTCQPLGGWQRRRSLPHMHQQRWDLAQIRMNDRSYRRRTRYHCASDPALSKST